MPTPFTIRPFTPADYEAIAQLVAADSPEQLYDYEFRSAGEFHDLDASFAAVGQPLARYVAADASGRVVGYAQHFEIGWSEPAGRYWLVLRVHPDARRRGVGTQLFARVEEDLAQLGARAVVAELVAAIAVVLPGGETGQHLRRERLVDLPGVDVAEREAVPPQDRGDGMNRAEGHM